MPYAVNTEVPVDRSRLELERTLMKAGATSFYYHRDSVVTTIGFKIEERSIRFAMPMPLITDFIKTPNGRVRTPRQVQAEYDQEQRRRWRALNLVVKAKLEAIESGISTLDDEFLSFIVLGNGETIGEAIKPQMELLSEPDTRLLTMAVE